MEDNGGEERMEWRSMLMMDFCNGSRTGLLGLGGVITGLRCCGNGLVYAFRRLQMYF